MILFLFYMDLVDKGTFLYTSISFIESYCVISYGGIPASMLAKANISGLDSTT